MRKGLFALTVVVLSVTLAYGTAFAGTIQRVSVNSDGEQGIGGSTFSDISADGRYVVFASDAGNLVPDDTNNVSDIFRYDRKTRTTERVSLGPDNQQLSNPSYSPAISSDGRYVAFGNAKSPNVWSNILYVRDMVTGQTQRVSKVVNRAGSYGFGPPKISGDGRYIVSRGATSSWNGEVVLFDRVTGDARIASLTGWGTRGGNAGHPKISANGQFVIFFSTWNLVDPYPYKTGRILYIYDVQNNTINYASYAPSGKVSGLNICGYGYDFDISGDGRYITYRTYKYFLVYDRVMEKVRETPATGCEPALSDSGNTITYMGGNQIYTLDLATDAMELISQNSDGVQGNGSSRIPAISEDGRFISFYSNSSNLVANDTNNVYDVFVYDRIGLPQTIDELIAYVEQLYADGLITNQGVENALITSLDAAQAAQDRGNTNVTNNTLLAFINKVQAQSGKHIEASSDATLVEATQGIIDAL